jgi:nicotinamidase-related amidase
LSKGLKQRVKLTISTAARILYRAIALGLVVATTTAAFAADPENVIDEWNSVKIPPAPELHKVTLDPKTTVLMVMGFVRSSCNMTRRPRCVATIPHVAKLLTEAREHGVFVVHSVPTGSEAANDFVPELKPLPGEYIIPPNGPNKFLPYDLQFHVWPNFDLEKVFHDHNIKTVITVGTQVNTAVLHTAAEAALRDYKAIVPVDGMSGDGPVEEGAFPELYTAWHLANTERVRQQVTLTKVDLMSFE